MFLEINHSESYRVSSSILSSSVRGAGCSYGSKEETPKGVTGQALDKHSLSVFLEALHQITFLGH